MEHLSEIDKDGNVSEEVIDYVESHDLYKHGLALYRYDSEKQNVIYNIYAKHLSSNQMYTDAAVAYEMLGKFKEAMGHTNQRKDGVRPCPSLFRNSQRKLSQSQKS